MTSTKRVCVITGAAGRIGAALADALLEDYSVVAVYHRTPISTRNQHCKEISRHTSKRPNLYTVQADLADVKDIQRLQEVTLAKFGKIDHLVNCAADVKFYGRLSEIWARDIGEELGQMQLNAFTPFLLASSFFMNYWREEREENLANRRSILNISSVSGLYALPDEGQASYGASKAALNYLTLHLSLELSNYCVRVNGLCAERVDSQQKMDSLILGVQIALSGTETGKLLRPVENLQ